MKIDDKDLYHGAALLQIAEHATFKAINQISIDEKVIHSAYRINDNSAIYLKYCSKCTGSSLTENVFTFTVSHMSWLSAINNMKLRTYIGLVCVEAREICVISFDQLLEIKRSRNVAGPLTVTVTTEHGKKFRVFTKSANGQQLGLIKIARNDFPSVLFD